MIKGPIGMTALHKRWCIPLILFLSEIPQFAEARRRLQVDESISAHLKVEHAMGFSHPQFTIAALEPSSGEEYDINVVEAHSAVTATTTYSVDGGPSMLIGDLGINLLVSDSYTGEDGSAGTPRFTIIAVDEQTGQVNGISQAGGGKLVNIVQQGADVVTATEADEFEPPEWSCGVTDDFEENLMHHSEEEHGIKEDYGIPDFMQQSEENEGIQSIPSDEFSYPAEFSPADGMGGPFDDHRLNEGSHRSHEHHHDHSHHPPAGHKHLHSQDINGNTLMELMDSITKEITQANSVGSSHSYPTDSFPHKWSYEVQLYIEIDQDFVNISGGGNLTQAFQYVNLLLVAVSSLFEREIDTHLHVQHIAKTDLYAPSDVENTLDALIKMLDTYANADGWHYQDAPIDLHHAILGKNLGGGVAAGLGNICDPSAGFSLSADIRGGFASIDAASVWDFFVVAHELGHNFGSGHTFDKKIYYPLVETCWDSGQNTQDCPNDLPLEGSATIMGYCYVCPGGMPNLAYTFGGQWHEGYRPNVDNWRNSNLPGAVANEPRRVPKTMWDVVSSRGTCVDPGSDVPTFGCTQDDDCFDGVACTVDSCNLTSGTCENVVSSNCTCENFVCEVGEDSCQDCGPFTLKGEYCEYGCYSTRGIMFDISSKNDITLNGFWLKFYSSTVVSSYVTVYTAPGNYSTHYNNPSSWTQVHREFISTESFGLVSLNFEGLNINNLTTQALYIWADSAGIVVSKDKYVTTDDNLSVMAPARYIFSEFGSGTFETQRGPDISWAGHIMYSLQVPCNQDSDCDDGKSCTEDICESGKCEHPISSNCCGNEICEVNEDGCTADCGPWTLQYPFCSTYGEQCYQSSGMMFDVTATESITVTSITLVLVQGENIKLDIWTRMGTYDGYHMDPLAWNLLASSSEINLGQLSFVTIPVPSTEIQAGATQSFYATYAEDSDSNVGIYCGALPAPLVADDKVEIKSPARVFVNSDPFSNPSFAQYSFQGKITYIATAAITPTVLPSAMPTLFSTTQPSFTPSLTPAPTQSLVTSKAPSFGPSMSDSDPPSVSIEPIALPSLQPSNSLDPTLSASLIPSVSSQPSDMPKMPSSLPTTFPSVSSGPTVHASNIPSTSNVPTAKPTLIPSDTSQPSDMPTAEDTAAAQWFMDWDILRCRKDCNGNFPCGGSAHSWTSLYDTVQACCAGSFQRHPDLAVLCEVTSLKTPEASPATPSDSESLFNA